jgi:L-threonylcarbamoyladenylate synthase
MSDKNATEVVPADAPGIAHAVRILETGGLVAVPTETVYGLAARADSAAAVARIYAAKGRPGFNPLIVHVRDALHAARYGVFLPAAAALAAEHWPGPLTLVVPRRRDAALAEAVTAGLPTIALRVPAHPTMQALLAAVDFPLAAPSANRSGWISPTSPEHVLATLDGRIDLVLDGPVPERGIESTILAIGADGGIEELRPGPIDASGLRQSVIDPTGQITAPGQLASHYSPGKPMRLAADTPTADEYFIGIGAIACDFNLSPDCDRVEAEARLYRALHEAASSFKPRIAVAPDVTALSRGLADRLRRAATPPG